ncbi:MAG: arginine--tRNA ligase [Parcubacteria group bacterium]|nr:arginine--tRNA ligase [Parcubacteria group bacterium]|tara:strand:+ start:714 stop:2267 length:1554 start_codon:yes stop_codon:yes gene_type:complete
MLRGEIEKLIKDIVKKDVHLEHPANLEFGDFSTNVAMQTKIDPQKIISKLKDNQLFEKIEVVGPARPHRYAKRSGQGFINFFLSKNALTEEVSEILSKRDDYGSLDVGQDKKVQVEFISANPTGPLTVGNARGGPLGDVLANILNKAGFKCEKAFYVNDAGMQILTLGHSVLKDDQAKYQGEYIDQLNKKIKEKDPFKAGQLAAKHIIKDLIQKTTDKLGVKYDEWIFESDLHQLKKVDQALSFLKKKGLIYEKDEAEWFKSKQFGDERDRVMIKKDGNNTYLAGDIALHRYKFEDKKFDQVINIWGADHHGDVPGLMAGVEAIGHKDKLKVILLQFVTILDKGEKQKMSKRAGLYVEMDELLDKVGPDAVRFFFLQKSADTHLNFDLALAQEQSAKNPVYYIQYAHARICSILRKAELKGNNKDLDSLNHPTELNLIRQLIKFPEMIEDIARDYQVQRLPYYSLELAHSFHKFYEQCRVLDKDKKIAQARINLVKTTQIILKNTLGLMGINAPEKM